MYTRAPLLSLSLSLFLSLFLAHSADAFKRTCVRKREEKVERVKGRVACTTGAGGDEKQKKTRDSEGTKQKEELEKESERWMRTLRMKRVDGAKNETGSS